MASVAWEATPSSERPREEARGLIAGVDAVEAEAVGVAAVSFEVATCTSDLLCAPAADMLVSRAAGALGDGGVGFLTPPLRISTVSPLESESGWGPIEGGFRSLDCAQPFFGEELGMRSSESVLAVLEVAPATVVAVLWLPARRDTSDGHSVAVLSSDGGSAGLPLPLSRASARGTSGGRAGHDVEVGCPAVARA